MGISRAKKIFRRERISLYSIDYSIATPRGLALGNPRGLLLFLLLLLMRIAPRWSFPRHLLLLGIPLSWGRCGVDVGLMWRGLISALNCQTGMQKLVASICCPNRNIAPIYSAPRIATFIYRHDCPIRATCWRLHIMPLVIAPIQMGRRLGYVVADGFPPVAVARDDSQ